MAPVTIKTTVKGEAKSVGFKSDFDAVIWMMRNCLTPAEVQRIRLDVGRSILNSFEVREYDNGTEHAK